MTDSPASESESPQSTESPAIGNDAGVDERSVRQLFVEFEARMSGGSCCPLLNINCSIVDVRQQLADSECRLDARVSDDDTWPTEATQIEHTRTSIDPDCPCPVFAEYDCVPQVSDTTNEAIIIETYLPDREYLTDLITELRTIVDDVSIRRLKRVDTHEGEDKRKFITIDLYKLTEKQRQAVTTAVAEGYYSTPREVSLGELAEQLDLSKSALSQRLKAVESKLATSAFSRATVKE